MIARNFFMARLIRVRAAPGFIPTADDALLNRQFLQNIEA